MPDRAVTASLVSRRLLPKSTSAELAKVYLAPGWRAAQWVDDLVGAADLVIIDATPHAEAYVRITVRAARLVAVPVPSPLGSVGDRQVRSGLVWGFSCQGAFPRGWAVDR
jgi:hypothetical protein